MTEAADLITLWYKLANGEWEYNHYSGGWSMETRPFKPGDKRNKGRWSKEPAFIDKQKIIHYFNWKED